MLKKRNKNGIKVKGLDMRFFTTIVSRAMAGRSHES
jgi:hypothetical protein